jgi:SAM-dependent methyltransferase
MSVSVFPQLHPRPRRPLSDAAAVQRRVWTEAREHLERYVHVLRPGDRVLDVGVGPGRTARLVEAAVPGAQVTGLDVIDVLQEDVPLVLYDGLSFPFEDGRFDVALVLYTLHHARQPARVLDEAVRVARRAVVVIEEFDHPDADPELEETMEASTLAALGLPPDLHHAPLERDELERLLSRHPLALTRSERLPTRSTRRIDKQLYVLEHR